MIVLLAAIAVVAVLGLWFALRRGPRHEPGMVSFQRHIDALSPEARRQVRDHLQPDATGDDHDDKNDGDDDAPVDGNEEH